MKTPLLKSRCRAFTFIEIMLVMVILVIGIGMVTAWTNGALVRAELQATTESVVSLSRTLQAAAHSRFGDIDHGIYFEIDQYTSFEGASYALSDPASRNSFSLANALEFNNMALGAGGSELVFQKGTGETILDGTIQIEHLPTGDFFLISISSLGLVDWQ